ncbi:hypothetical protein M404DRAFT_127771 [Pisolithus tinctorius Marx 270]|uniref:Uncharacterized protein n=1 Tax=Pisolithus tinctorius Marx 270 TaxID=870435 RepID=A0A0C3KNA1_PISTI|nr:hypothetical protein M404DRAFT_127771 [Pisolithus tinctorius Marx 270]
MKLINTIYLLTPTTRVVQWPEFITQSFHSAISSDPIGTEESVFYGPYTRLLYHLFSFYGPYEIVPQYKIRGSQDGIDVTPTFIIELQKKPVFFIEIEPAASLPVITRRQEVDNQMRERVGDLRANLAIPVLHGVSAFGTRLCFYKYDSRSRELTPQRIPEHPTRVTDIMPAHNWSCDVLNTDGMQRLQKVVEEVKEMCAQSRPAT